MRKNMKEAIKQFFQGNKVRKTLGVLCIIVGTIALLTPLSPGAWLIPIGLGFLGVRLAFWEKLKAWWRNRRSRPSQPSDQV